MTLRIIFLFSSIILLASCNKDEPRSCTTCTSELTAAFEVCSEPDGTASINGEDTDIDYNDYLEGLQEEGVVCGN